jgi:hypothetical protein
MLMMRSRIVGDPHYANVSLLLHADGTNNSTTIVDSGPLGLTGSVQGNARISTAQSKFGGSSLYFDGAGDRVHYANDSALDFGTGDFTVESWVYVISQQTFYTHLIGKGSGFGGEWSLALYSGPAYFIGGGSSLTGTTTLANNAWHHIAATRASGTLRLFVNGTLEASVTSSGNISSSRTFNIGDRESGDPYLQYPHNGYLDEVRITKGVARYTASFTVPAEPFLSF